MIKVHNYPYENTFLFCGSVVANIIIYLIFLYCQQKLKKYYMINISIEDFLLSISITFGSILTARYLNTLFHKDTMNIYNFFLLILIIQILKRIIFLKLYKLTKYKIFYNNIKYTYELLLLDIFNILLSLFFGVIFIKSYKYIKN